MNRKFDITHKIEVDLEVLPSDVKRYVQDIINSATEKSIRVELINDTMLPLGLDKVNGYFWGDELLDCNGILAVACGKDYDKWFETFVHESCHMDQYLEKVDVWTAGEITDEIDSFDLVLLWINNKIELTEAQLKEYIAHSRNVELDCEKRTVEKIKEYNLPIDPELYTRKSNAYVLFYNMIALKRAWYTPGKEPYNQPETTALMSDKFDMDYEQLTPEIYEAFNKYYED